MLMRQRRDWFPVVATDLFCGVLAAVIILDAVAPKEASNAGSEVLLTVSYKNGQPLPDGTLPRCSKGNVVFQFKDATKFFNTLDAVATETAVEGMCRIEAFFPDVNFDRGMSDKRVVVAQYHGVLDEVIVSVTGDKIVCTVGSAACPVE